MAPITFLLSIFICVSIAESFVLKNKGQEKFSCSIEGVCRIRNVHSGEEIVEALKNSPYLKLSESLEISFVHSNLKSYPSELFELMENLRKAETVNVRFSIIAQDDFKHAKNLQHLIMSTNIITHLPSQIFSLIPNLISVDLSRNFINSIDSTTFSGVSLSLKSINLGFNHIMVAVMPHLKLKYLNLQHNFIESFETFALEVKELNLNGNHMKTLRLIEQPMILQADNNNFVEFTITDRMMTVSLENNNIATLNCNTNAKIESLNLSGNELPNNSLGGLKLAEKLKILDLSGNRLKTLDLDTFAKMTSLEELNLSASRLGNLAPRLFEHQGNLKILNISHNRLLHFSSNLIKPLRRLESLDINGNDLKKFERFERLHEVLPELKKIGLQDNSWTRKYFAALLESSEAQGLQIDDVSEDKKEHWAEMEKKFRDKEPLKEIDLKNSSDISKNKSLTLAIFYGLSLIVFIICFCFGMDGTREWCKNKLTEAWTFLKLKICCRAS